MAVLAELDLQLLHFIVMEILLDQVALTLHSSPHVRGNVGNHPGHEELDQEHDMLWRKNAQQVSFTLKLRATGESLHGFVLYMKKCVCGRIGGYYYVTINYCPS